MVGLAGLKEGVTTDPNLIRARNAVSRGASAAPSATSRYLLEKIPIVSWLPRYSPKWIVNDLVAGLTIGVLLVPQALAYAKIATIPLQDGLLASWLPSALYFVMGTSKDISVGPTSIIGLLSAEIIKNLSGQGLTPTAIITAISFSVGVYGLIMGLLKLGWLLDLISLPVLTGFVGAAGLTIMIGQIPALFGITAGSGVAQQIHDIILGIPKTKPLTAVIGFIGLFMIFGMQWIAKKWGKSKAIWVMGIMRNAIVLVLFTGISFGVNQKRPTNPVFDLTSTVPSGLLPPTVPSTSIIGKVFSSSVAVFIASALEHIAISKSFARRNGYVIDESQELTFVGTINMLNSFFGGMPVGGAFSRTAVNSESGVKSPASGLVTTVTVIASLYFLTGAIFWIPKATLSAVIVAAVWQILVPPSVFYKYWKTSLADFTASQLAFWITLFVSAETGIETAAAFMIVITLLRNMFTHIQTIYPNRFQDLYPAPHNSAQPQLLPGFALLRFSQALMYLNAYSTKGEIMDSIQTHNKGVAIPKVSEAERLWSDQGPKRIAFLRQKAEVHTSQLPQLRVVILDFSACNYIDTTGIQAIIDMKAELLTYGGAEVELRFVGISELIYNMFKRAGWELGQGGQDLVFESMVDAVNAPVNNMTIADQDAGSRDENYDDDAELVYEKQYTTTSYNEAGRDGRGRDRS